MARSSLFIALLILAPACLWADDTKKAPPQQTPEEQFQSLSDALGKARKDLQSESRAARTDAERQTVQKKKEQVLQEFAGRFLTWAQKYPTAEPAFGALEFVLANAPGTTADAALELVTKHYSDQLSGLCQTLATQSAPGAEAALRTILRKGTSVKVQAQARLGLAKFLKKKSESENVGPKEAARFAEEADQLYSMVVAGHDLDSSSLEDAKNELWELRNLGIGKKALDISGKDVDGKAFQLSDYQGKVVVLDFWANW